MVSQRRGVISREEQVVNRKECCDLIVQALDRHLTIPIQGTLTQKKLFQGLAGMAASNQSIHSTSHILTNVPCETSFRYHFAKLDITELERINNFILTYSIQDVLKRGTAYRFAIDITHDPYYGETIQANKDYVIHSQLKKSTTDFYSYVTVYVITKDRQMTLAGWLCDSRCFIEPDGMEPRLPENLLEIPPVKPVVLGDAGPLMEFPVLCIKIRNRDPSAGQEQRIKGPCGGGVPDMVQGHGTHDDIKPGQVPRLLPDTPFTRLNRGDSFGCQFLVEERQHVLC